MSAPHQIKGWRVYVGSQNEQQKKLGTWSWKSISQLFVVRSAAADFERLASKYHKHVEVRPEYVR